MIRHLIYIHKNYFNIIFHWGGGEGFTEPPNQMIALPLNKTPNLISFFLDNTFDFEDLSIEQERTKNLKSPIFNICH